MIGYRKYLYTIVLREIVIYTEFKVQLILRKPSSMLFNVCSPMNSKWTLFGYEQIVAEMMSCVWVQFFMSNFLANIDNYCERWRLD